MWQGPSSNWQGHTVALTMDSSQERWNIIEEAFPIMNKGLILGIIIGNHQWDIGIVETDLFSMMWLFLPASVVLSTPLLELLVVFGLLRQENAASQPTFHEMHPPILPPVRDGDSDSTTTPGMHFPLMGCPGHFPGWPWESKKGRSHDWESRKVPLKWNSEGIEIGERIWKDSWVMFNRRFSICNGAQISNP